MNFAQSSAVFVSAIEESNATLINYFILSGSVGLLVPVCIMLILINSHGCVK